MPNWVFNNVFINGDPAELDKFALQAGQPHERVGDDIVKENGKAKIVKVQYTREEPISFWNFVKPEDEATYNQDSNWYGWNLENWGTKWEAEGVVIERDAPEQLVYRFTTAWSVPYGVYEAMASQYPTLEFDCNCEEETGWIVDLEYRRGRLAKKTTMPEPDSHADYVARGREESCVCTWNDDPSEFYEDCPNYKAKEADPLAEKIRQQIIAGSGVSQEWADKHLKVVI